MLKNLVLAGAVSLMGSTAFAACSYQNETEIKMLSAGFEAWKAVADAMAECGNFQAELDQEFRTKQPAAFEANPSLYHIGGVSNGTVTPLLNSETIRPLDDLVAKYWPEPDAQPAHPHRRTDHGRRDDGQHPAPDVP